MSLLDRKNFNQAEHWYTNGIRVVWWDRKIKAWTTYLIDAKKNQRSSTQYYANRWQFEACEKLGHFDWDSDYETLQTAIKDEQYG